MSFHNAQYQRASKRFVKCHIVVIVGFTSRDVSAGISQLHSYGTKAATDNRKMQKLGCGPIKLGLQKQVRSQPRPGPARYNVRTERHSSKRASIISRTLNVFHSQTKVLPPPPACQTPLAPGNAGSLKEEASILLLLHMKPVEY